MDSKQKEQINDWYQKALDKEGKKRIKKKNISLRDKANSKDSDIQKICTIIGGMSFVLFWIAFTVAPNSGKFYSEGFTLTMNGLEPTRIINWATVIPLIIAIGCFIGYNAYKEDE